MMVVTAVPGRVQSLLHYTSPDKYLERKPHRPQETLERAGAEHPTYGLCSFSSFLWLPIPFLTCGLCSSCPIPQCPSHPAHPWAEGQSPRPHHSCPHHHWALGDTVPGSGNSLPFRFCQKGVGRKEKKPLVRSRHSSYTFEHRFSLT